MRYVTPLQVQHIDQYISLFVDQPLSSTFFLISWISHLLDYSFVHLLSFLTLAFIHHLFHGTRQNYGFYQQLLSTPKAELLDR